AHPAGYVLVHDLAPRGERAPRRRRAGVDVPDVGSVSELAIATLEVLDPPDHVRVRAGHRPPAVPVVDLGRSVEPRPDGDLVRDQPLRRLLRHAAQVADEGEAE